MERLESKLPVKIINLLEDSLAPICVSYFSTTDKYLNLKCNFSNFEKYEQGNTYSVYNVKSILRVLLLKSAIIKENLIEEIFKVDSDEFCLVLNDSKSFDFLVFSTKSLTTFKDQQLLKTLQKNIHVISSEMEKFK